MQTKNNVNYHLFSAVAPVVLAVLLVGCGAQTDKAAAAPSAASGASAPAAPVAVKAPATVFTAFKPAHGSAGNGAVMSELKGHNGTLRDPEAKYDVFDGESKADLKTLAQDVVASLDRNHNVLLDSNGTPESREKMAKLAYEAIGASLPDNAAVLIRKLPEENGGGYGLIPIYTKAETAAQIAQGKILKPEDLNNSAENFFFESKQSSQPKQ